VKLAASSIFTGILLAFGVAVAEDSKPIELTDAQMDLISAGSLQLPNGNVQHELFDNPAPNVNGYVEFCDTATGMFCHPALTRRSVQVLVATGGDQPTTVAGFPDGPWSATSVSPVITCVGAPIEAGGGVGGTGTGCSL
jgi:hypothetical protein